MKTIAMIAAAAAVLSMMSIAMPMPADAGWCIEACGLKRVVRAPSSSSSTVTCTTQSYGGNRQTTCTRN